MNTKRLTVSGLLIAIGTISGHMVYIPIGVAKVFPIQHMINVLSAVLLGPFYGLANGFLISLLRNILGTGSLLAFPGSMIGALLAGLLYKKSKNIYLSALGEVFGTGILGGLAAYPVATFLLGAKVSPLFFITPFALSSLGGSLLSLMILNVDPLKSQVLREQRRMTNE